MGLPLSAGLTHLVESPKKKLAREGARQLCHRGRCVLTGRKNRFCALSRAAGLWAVGRLRLWLALDVLAVVGGTVASGLGSLRKNCKES